MRRHVWVSAAVVAVSVAACGGSSHPSATSAGSSTAGSGTAAASGSATASGGSATVAPSPGSSSATATLASSSSSETAARSAARARDTDVRLPAKFTIGAGGTLAPSVVSAPKHTDVALTVSAGDGKAHSFVLRTPHEYRLTVLPSRAARVLLKGIPDGTYVVEVDHVQRGDLIIGAAPGP